MRALSLTQPWATLMALGAKRYETRDWSAWGFGQVVAIVASKSFPPACRVLCSQEPFRSVLLANGIEGPTQLPLGAVVALVELVTCIATKADGIGPGLSRMPPVLPATHERHFGDYSPGRYAFITRNAVPIVPTVPVERVVRDKRTGEMVVKAGGALGFYTLSPACEALVRARMEGRQ